MDGVVADAVMAHLYGEVIETLQRRSARVLLTSPHFEEVRLALRLLRCDLLRALSVEVVSHALAAGDRDIVMLLAHEECMDFPALATLAFAGDLEVEVDGYIWYDTLPESTYALLLELYDTGAVGDLEFDFPLAIGNAIKRADHDVVVLLCERPEADLAQQGQEYLLDCIYDGVVQLGSLLYLLDQREVIIDQGIVDEFLWDVAYPGDDLGLYDSLLVHPRTRQYVLAYEERQRQLDHESSEDGAAATAV